MDAARSLPTVKDAVKDYLGDARAHGLAEDTIKKLTTLFEKQLLAFCEKEETVVDQEWIGANTSGARSARRPHPIGENGIYRLRGERLHSA
jgi:hypothetical protein